jgi:hypothetical protein
MRSLLRGRIPMNNEELNPYLRLKNVFRELTLCRAFIQLMKLQGLTATVSGRTLSVNELLDITSKSPKLDAYVDARFMEFEKSLALADESLFDRVLRELLEESNLYGQVHDKSNETLN